MALYIFDVDGVLTDTGYNINPDFQAWFINWSKNKKYALTTGSTLDRTREQIGNEIVENAVFCANCMANSVYQNKEVFNTNQFALTAEEIEFLENKIKESKFKTHTGNHIVSRIGSVNFSIVGRNATVEQREEYKKFDQIEQERIQIRKELLEQFNRFDVFIGGDISIDICLRTANKRRVLFLAEPHANKQPIYFFGDKMGEHGIDRPLAEIIRAQQIGKSFEIINGYKQTKHILAELG